MTERNVAEQKRLKLKQHLPSWPFVGLAALVVGLIVGAFIYSGLYNIAADAPHTKPVYWLMQNLRDRSIAVRARNIKPPSDLDSPKRISIGAGLYDDMCSGCHLAPGMAKTEISQGLYPRAPELFRGVPHSPGQEFWIIKHGIKMTGMAAWGKTHNDELIWDMVAFIRSLPTLSAAQYQAAVKSAPADHDTMMRDMPTMDMPAMPMPPAASNDSKPKR